MEFLMPVAILIFMLALVVAHCWCVSALFSYRFGFLRGIAWLLPLVLLPLIGPLIFYFSTRRFREINRPSRKRVFAYFAAVMTLFLTVVTYISVEQYQHFNRRAADATVMSDLKKIRYLLLERIENSGQAPESLSEISFAPSKPEIHIKYRKIGRDDFELTGWHDKGEREMKASSTSNAIERMPKKNP